MRIRVGFLIVGLLLTTPLFVSGGAKKEETKPTFQTSDRCLACHNQLTDANGKDISIGTAWRASVMGNSSRDPYWQASIRREAIDHPAAQSEVEDSCTICHMPIVRYEHASEG